MKLLLLAELIPSGIAKALSWALLLSLYEGLLFAILAAAVILSTKQARPRIRYNMLLGLFACQIIVSIGTIVYQLMLSASGGGGGDIGMSALSSGGVGGQVIVSLAPAAESMPMPARFLNDNASFIVNAWLCVMAILLLRTALGMGYLGRLKRFRTNRLPSHVEAQFMHLAEAMNVRQPVRVLESGLAKMPIVIGFFKPLILIPAGLVSNLPADQVEAMLCHELAHIRRYDYAVNLLQTLAETIFFFNPCTWWISSLLRDAREHCCDDMALDSIADKRTFVKALLSFASYKQRGYVLAPGFAGSRYKLVGRVERIFSGSNYGLTNLAKFILTGSVLVSALALAAFNRANEPRMSGPAIHQNMERVAGGQGTVSDTLPEPNDLQKKLAKIDEKYASQEKEIKEQRKAMMAARDRLEQEAVTTTGEDRENMLARMDSLDVAMDMAASDLRMRRSAEVRRALGYPDERSAGGAAAEASKQGPGSLREKDDMDRGKGLSEKEKERADEQHEADRINASPDTAARKSWEEGRRRVKEMEASATAFFGQMIQDLEQDKIITSGEHVSFMLSNTKLIVNDREQPANIQRQFADKYLKNKRSTLVYKFHGDMIGVMDDNSGQSNSNQ